MKEKFIDTANTIVIADFDGTFTKKEVGGQKSAALMTALADEKYLGKTGVARNKELFDHYYPIETNPYLDEKEKAIQMQEWWENVFEMFKNSKVKKEMFLEVCRSPLVQWREDLLEFLNLLDERKIPLFIFSAGAFGKLAIDYLLELSDALTENIKVLSNEIIFNEDGTFSEVALPIIHISNKNGSSLIKNGLIKQKPSRRNCFLIGDSLQDAKMSDGINFDSVYKVAFSSTNTEYFSKAFNEVLPVDGSYRQIIDLFN